MFVKNKTDHAVVLARAHLSDDVAVLSLNLELAYRVGSGEPPRLIELPTRADGDPPDTRRRPLWRGVSITASGHVLGPGRAPYVRVVQLALGQLRHRLVVYGERRWRRSVGRIVADEPRPFDAVPLTWERAFGGHFDRPPGYSDDGRLPHPGGRFTYALNPRGMGLYQDEAHALDAELPQIEREDMPVRTWSDRPIPGGLAPCGDIPGLRVDMTEGGAVPDDHSGAARVMFERPELILRQLHHAPGATIVSAVEVGAALRLDGLGRDALMFQMPSPPVEVGVGIGRLRDLLTPRVRSVHIDANEGVARVVFGFPYRYHPLRAPRRVFVQSKETAP